MSVNVCPVLTFLPDTKRGSGDREREREFRTEMRGEDESQFFEENRHVILHNFFELQYVSVAFLQYLSYLSLSCTFSLSFSISHSLSVAVWSFWRPLHSISHWRCRRVSLCSLKPDSPQISPFAPYVLWDWRRHAFYICGFFFKIFRNLLPLWIRNHPPVALQVKTKRVPFSETDLKRCTLLFCKLHFVQDSIRNSIANIQ